VVIHAHAELLAALAATVLQYTPPTFAFHALAKAMNTEAPALLGLICTFWHPITLLKKPGRNALGILH
jgi:hypothetical protein